MALPGQQPDFNPYDLVREGYEVFREVQQTIDKTSAELLRQARTELGQVEGIVAGTQQILSDQLAAPVVQAQQLVSDLSQEVRTLAASEALEPQSMALQLEQISELVPVAPQAPQRQGANGRQRLTEQTETQPSPPLAPLPSGPTIPGAPSQPIQQPPIPPLSGSALCAALQAILPSDTSQVYTVWQWVGTQSYPPQSMPGGYAVAVGNAYPPETIGPPDVAALVSGADTYQVLLTLSTASGCALTYPQPPPQPPVEPPPEIEPPIHLPGPEIPPPEAEEPPFVPPSPPLPESCGGGTLQLPECYYWTDGCGQGGWDLWFQPETCTLVRVNCGCNPNDGCPPPIHPYVKLGSVGIRPRNQCVIEGVVSWNGHVIPPEEIPPVIPPEINPCAAAIEPDLGPRAEGEQGVCFPPGEEVPPAAPPPPPPFVPTGRIDWNSPTVCKEIDALSNLPDEKTPVDAFLFAAGLQDAFGNPTTPEWSYQIADSLRIVAFPSLDGLFKQVRLILATVFPLANELQYQSYVDSVLADPNRISIADAIASAARGLLKFGALVGYSANQAFSSPAVLWWRFNAIRQVINLLQSWLGLDMSGVLRLIDYTMSYLHPTIIPTPADANVALLNGEITDELWECWVKANGLFPRPAKAVMESQRTKPNAMDVIRLDMRELITPEEQLVLMRQAGFRKPEDYLRLRSLQQLIPNPSEIIMMMGRDAADEGIVTEFNTDDQFGDKFAGKLKDWARQNGLTEEHMRFLWRSHWKIPSPTQLFEMVHRHRHREPEHPLYTDLGMVKKALSQDDVLPFWQDRLVSVAYLPINWTRAIEAYTLDAINEDQMRQIIYDEGYNDDDTEILLDLANRKRLYAKANAQHLPSVEQALRRYRSGAISRFQAKRWIVERGFQPADADRALDSAIEQEDADSRARKLEALRQRFRHGEMDSTGAVNQAIEIGLNEEDAERVVRVWVEQQSIRDKHITAYRLCKMFKYGIITLDNYFRRLLRLGFTEEDANNIIKTCQADLAKEIAREQAKAAKQAAKKPKR